MNEMILFKEIVANRIKIFTKAKNIIDNEMEREPNKLQEAGTILLDASGYPPGNNSK